MYRASVPSERRAQVRMYVRMGVNKQGETGMQRSVRDRAIQAAYGGRRAKYRYRPTETGIKRASWEGRQ